MLVVTPAISNTTLPKLSYIEQARLSLKNYGLANCLYKGLIDEQNIKIKDIGKSIGIWGPTGKGYYSLLQDDSLNILHDPYRVIRDFFNEERKLVPASLKDGSVNLTYQCLAVYNSVEFIELIHQQDPFIDSVIHLYNPQED